MDDSAFDWSDLAFGSKKPLRTLKATFIVAPREISAGRFTQLIKQYLPEGNVILGISKEPYVLGFDGQPQFRMLELKTLQKLINTVNQASPKRRIDTLAYSQRELSYIFEKDIFQKVVLVNGSWKQTFHTLPAYYALVKQAIPYEMVSAFVDEEEARTYEQRVMQEINDLHEFKPHTYAESEMLELANEAATYSFDYSHQTGATLGKQKKKGSYTFIDWSYNRVVPFQTYAMLHGASREQHFSPPHDLNHYDTVHAEVEMLIQAQRKQQDLTGTTLFINLLPCPSCARMLSETDITTFVYSIDHSDGYAVKLLEAAGKTVRRVVL